MRNDRYAYDHPGFSSTAGPDMRAKLIQRLVSWAERNGQSDIRADRQGMVSPEPVICEDTGRKLMPDATADLNGVGMLYAVESFGAPDDEIAVRRLTALASYARRNVLLFVLVVPRGQGDTARKIIDERRLDAQVLEIDI
jgi:hypothetical protein